MSYYRPRGDFFGDLWGGLTDVVSFAAPIVGAIAAPFTGGASLAIGAGIGAAARAAHGIGRGGPQTSPPGATNPIPETTSSFAQAVRAPRARRVRQPRQPRRGRRRLGRSAAALVVPPTYPPVLVPHDVVMAPFSPRLYDAAGGTMHYPGSDVLIQSSDPSPLLTMDQNVQTVPEFGGGGGGRIQTF
jgi:hypothetical protein